MKSKFFVFYINHPEETYFRVVQFPRTVVLFPDMQVLVTQSCPILCDAVDCSPPGSSVHGILQARKLEWVVISFSTKYAKWFQF